MCWTSREENPPQEASQCEASCKWVELRERTPCSCATEQMQHGFWACSLKLTLMWKKLTCCSCCCRHLLKACEDGANFLLGYCVSIVETRKTGKEQSKAIVLAWSLYRKLACRCKTRALSELFILKKKNIVFSTSIIWYLFPAFTSSYQRLSHFK